jgi:polyhydroxybutyrate depolymerase
VVEGRSSTNGSPVGKILVGVIAVAALVLVVLVSLAVRQQSAQQVSSSQVTVTTVSSSAVIPTTQPKPAATVSPDPGQAVDVDVVDHVVQMGLIQREYLTVTPKGLKPTDKLPVVVALHGLGVDRRAMLNAARWRQAVDQDRFIAVFPQGVANSWNLGPCCPPASLLAIDDLGFLDQVVAQVSAEPNADSQRFYLTGFSNGAIMAYYLGCKRPGVYQAIAPIAGSNLSGCTPPEPISVFHQHSDPDPVVPFDGKPTVAQSLSSAAFPSVPSSVAAWAAADGCPAQPAVSTEAGGVERSVWQPCAADTRVELVRLPGLGHNWPNKGAYDGLQELLAFFNIG